MWLDNKQFVLDFDNLDIDFSKDFSTHLSTISIRVINLIVVPTSMVFYLSILLYNTKSISILGRDFLNNLEKREI